MTRTTKKHPFFFILLAIVLSSCWSRYNQYESPSPWFHGLSYVPGGMCHVDTGQIICTTKYVMSTEVTNKMYREYLEDISVIRPPIHYVWAMPNTDMLKTDLWISKHLDYFNDPIFDDYPVVGVTARQAEAYAEWFTKDVKKKFLGSKNVYRLPTKKEWVYFARAGVDSEFFSGADTAFFATWSGIRQNSRACDLLRYFTMDERVAIYGDKWQEHDTLPPGIKSEQYELAWESILTATKNLKKPKKLWKALPLVEFPGMSDAYFPNDFNLFNLTGNVAEFVVSGDSFEVVGGSFRTGEKYCQVFDALPYPFELKNGAASDVGFRLVCDYVKPE